MCIHSVERLVVPTVVFMRMYAMYEPCLVHFQVKRVDQWIDSYPLGHCHRTIRAHQVGSSYGQAIAGQAQGLVLASSMSTYEVAVLKDCIRRRPRLRPRHALGKRHPLQDLSQTRSNREGWKAGDHVLSLRPGSPGVTDRAPVRILTAVALSGGASRGVLWHDH